MIFFFLLSMYFANVVSYSLYLLCSAFTTSFYDIAVFRRIPVYGRKSHVLGKMTGKSIYEKRDETKSRAVPVSKEKTDDSTCVAGTSGKSTSAERTLTASTSGKGPVNAEQM